MAEGIFRMRLEQAGFGDRIRLDSAGTGAWHVGEPPDRRAQAAARAIGADLSRLRARQFQRDDLRRFDLVLAMDADNLANIRRHPGAESRSELALRWLQFDAPHEVPDPYYGDAAGFAHVASLLDDAALRFVERWRRQTSILRGSVA